MHYHRTFWSTACRRATHYDTLGIQRDASPAQIKNAFVKLSKEHHPDVPDHKNKPQFHEISAAYNVLRDSVSRRAYDNTLPSLRAPGPSTLHSRHMADTAARFRRAASRTSSSSSSPSSSSPSSPSFRTRRAPSSDIPFARRPTSHSESPQTPGPLPGANDRHHRHPGQRYTPPDPRAQAAAWAAQKAALQEQKTRAGRYMAGIFLGLGVLFTAGWVTAEIG